MRLSGYLYRYCKRSHLIVLALYVAIFIQTPPTLANTTDFTFTPREQVWITQHPSVRISGPTSFPPFHFIGADNNFQGMASDYLQFVLEKAGIKPQYQTDLTWAQSLQEIKAKRIDILACAASSPARANYLNLTTPILSFPLVIISRKNSPFIGGIEDLNGRRIALTKGIMTEDWLHRDQIQFTPITARNIKEELALVAANKADASFQNLAAASYHIEKLGYTNLKIAAPTPYGNYNLHIAVRKDWPELVTVFNKALASMSVAQHQEIRQRWIEPIRYEHGLRASDFLLWAGLIGGGAAVVISVFFSWNRKLKTEIEKRTQAESDKEAIIRRLEKALEEIDVLHGILPLCSYCKQIRNTEGVWEEVDVYIHNNSQADISHSICPNCLEQHFPGTAAELKEARKSA